MRSRARRCVGQRGAGYLAAKTHVIELALHGAEAGLDVTQALAVGQLREGHGQVLVPARKPSQVRVAAITAPRTFGTPCGQILGQLCKDGATCIHTPLFASCRMGLPTSVSGFQIVPDRDVRILLLMRPFI